MTFLMISRVTPSEQKYSLSLLPCWPVWHHMLLSLHLYIQKVYVITTNIDSAKALTQTQIDWKHETEKIRNYDSQTMNTEQGMFTHKSESRNTAMRRRTTANMCKIKKYILDINILSRHAGLLQGCSHP